MKSWISPEACPKVPHNGTFVDHEIPAALKTSTPTGLHSPVRYLFTFHVTLAMDHKRAQTYAQFFVFVATILTLYNSLEALEQFIQSQKAALDRVHGDIERLKQLRQETNHEPSLGMGAIQDKVCSAFAQKEFCH